MDCHFFLHTVVWEWKLLSHVWLSAAPWTILSMEFSRSECWSGQLFPSPGDLPNPGIKPRSPALQADSLPADPLRKPKNTGEGSLSLLQQIFLTQELNWGLLHCRRILYQLSYQRIPHRSISQCYSVKGWAEIFQKYLEKNNQPLLMAPILLGGFLSDLLSYRIILSDHVWLNPGYQESMLLQAKIVDFKCSLLSSAKIK